MRVLLWVVGFIASAFFVAAEDPAGRPFEIEDYYRTAFVGGPTVDAAGQKAVFEVTRYDLEKAESWSEIWLMEANGSTLRQMTFGRHSDSGPVFSPDGSRIVFVSDRKHGQQLWLIGVDGGEARQLTDFPGGLADPVWSPDGAALAATAEVYPECGADAECNRTIAEAIEQSPLSVHVADELLFRHWSSWRDGRVQHILLVDANTGDITRDLTPGRWDSPVRSVGGGAAYAFSPDGATLCFASNRDEDQASSTNVDLWTVDVAGSDAHPEAQNLTQANPGWDANPRYSPDGRYIAFLSQETPGYESDLKRLAVLDLSSRSIRYLTDRKTFDNWVDDMRWLSDGRSLIFQAQVGGRTPLYRVPATGGEAKRIHTDASIGGWQLADGGAALIYSASGIARPPEIYRVGIKGDDGKRLTWFNRQLEEEVDIRPPEELWVNGPDGRRIHVWLVKPHGFDPGKTYPLILNVHGGPQMQWKDRYRGDWQVYPGKGYAVAFPNPTGSAGFGQDLVDGIACDWNGAVCRDLELVADRLGELAWVDDEHMGAMGWSWGGYMMMWFEGHSSRFKALASMMGVYDLRSMYSGTEELWFPEHDLCGPPWTNVEKYREWSPSSSVESFATPCLVITGERDYRVPYTQSIQFFTDLRKRNVPARLVVFPEAGHWPSWYEMAFYYTVHLDWFQRWLGGGGPPWSPEAFMRGEVFAGGV